MSLAIDLFCAYVVRCRIDGKVYVGITSRTLRQRWNEHLYASRRRPSGMTIAWAIAKHGAENFTMEAVCCARTWADICATEQALIEQYGCVVPNGYNLRPGGEGAYGHARTADAIERQEGSLGPDREDPRSAGALDRAGILPRVADARAREGRMIRKEVIGSATLYCGDCREILPMLGKVDAVVTDPPYGIGHQKGSGGRGKHSVRNLEAIAGDDAPFDPEPFLAFPEAILWGANHYAVRLPHGRWLAWDKLAGMEEFDSFSDVEFAWRKGRGKDRIFRHMWKGICKASEKAQGKERWHPTQKPIALMQWCIEMTEGTVLDPYMGSGTTGVAAARLDRPFIGIEIDQRYFEIACERIRKAHDLPLLQRAGG